MKTHFIIGQFKNEVPTLYHEVYETAVLNIDFVFIVIDRSNSAFPECNKYNFKQNKALSARNFTSICL